MILDLDSLKSTFNKTVQGVASTLGGAIEQRSEKALRPVASENLIPQQQVTANDARAVAKDVLGAKIFGLPALPVAGALLVALYFLKRK